MNTYQQKWIDVLKGANLKDWKIEPVDNDILVEMPQVTDLKVIRDRLPEVIAAFSLDNHEPKERLKFIIHNGYEQFDYLLNPGKADL